MEWEDEAIVLSGLAHGEGGLVVSLLAPSQGRVRAYARGGSSRAQAHLWQAGNLVAARWVGRVEGGLGHVVAELVEPAAARAMDDPGALAVLTATVAVADGALADHALHPGTTLGLAGLLRGIEAGDALLPAVAAWEIGLLGELGFGLDLGSCAVTGQPHDLRFVSPRTGRAVSGKGAGAWAERLLPLPAYLTPEGSRPGPLDAADALRLSGHFLARDVFGALNRDLPEARKRLADRAAWLAGEARRPLEG